MSARLALSRCWNHEAREAVARCPDCGRSYCRECVVEHEDRIVCRSCLEKLVAPVVPPKSARRWSLRPLMRIGGAFVGILAAWLVYFIIGRALLAVPENWHADTVLKAGIFDELD